MSSARNEAKKPSPSANTVRFSCYSVRIAIEFDSHVPLSEIRSLLRPESTEFERAAAKQYFSLLRPAGTDDEADDPMYLAGSSRLTSPPQFLGPALVALRKIIHLRIARARQGQGIYSGGVDCWNGQAIVSPVRSYAGK
jgi:hypothetical protein